MKINELSMCRICLVENVRMYVVANKNLQEVYEKLTDIPFFTEDSRPMLACFFCYTKLKQCWRLQRKCLESEKLFAQMLKEDYELSEAQPGSSSDTGSSLQYVQRKGGIVLLRAGYQYLRKRQYKSGAIIWECNLRKKNKCSGTLTIKDDKILKEITHTSCTPDFNKNLIDFHLDESKKKITSGLDEGLDKTKRQLNQDHFNEYIVSPTVHISIFDECQTEGDIKQESLSDCGGQDNENITELKHEFQDIEYVNAQPYHSEDESYSEDVAPLLVFKTEFEEQEDIRTHNTGSKNIHIPLIEIKTEAEEEPYYVSKKKHQAKETKSAPGAKKQKLDKRRAMPENTITAQQKKTEQPDSKIIWNTIDRASEPVNNIKNSLNSRSSSNLNFMSYSYSHS